jgi:hypothetical protein
VATDVVRSGEDEAAGKGVTGEQMDLGAAAVETGLTMRRRSWPWGRCWL